MMTASIGISLGLVVVTGRLSALIGAAETTAMRQLIRRIIKEADEEVVDRLLAEVTEPITGKLEQMTEDMIFDRQRRHPAPGRRPPTASTTRRSSTRRWARPRWTATT